MKNRNKKRRIRISSIIKSIVAFILVICVIGVTVGLIFAKEVVDNIPAFDNSNLSFKEQSIIYDKNGDEIATVGVPRKSLKYDEIPEVFINAMLSMEDARFFAHDGIDKPRFLFASINGITKILKGSNDVSGASTLTMQVSKNYFTRKTNFDESNREKIERKIQDLYVSKFVIEEKYTKEEIFEFYVNSQNLGNHSDGLAAAAYNYFQKDVKDLNLAEASFLAGLFHAPSTYDPTNPYNGGTGPAEKRRNTVLDLMVRHGYISQEQCDLTKQIPLASYLNPNDKFNNTTPEYTDYVNTVISEVIDTTGYSPYVESMLIYTNMDPVLQRHMYDQKINQQYPDEALEIAVTVIDNSDGTIAGITSGRDTNEVGLNYATALHQPGSTAKPLLDYGPCFEQGKCRSTNETIADEEYKYSDGTKIANWDNKYKGTMTLTQALAQSRNIPALKVFQRNDPTSTVEMTRSMGLNLGIDPSNGVFYEAHAIGGYTGESTTSLAGAYAAYARGGLYTPPKTVSKVVIDYSSKQPTEQLLTQETKQVMKTTTADAINTMLSSANSSYIPGVKGQGINSAIKTGTSNWDKDKMRSVGLGNSIGARDLWSVVYTPEYTTALWASYDMLTPEHAQNGWYFKSWYEQAINERLITPIALGPHQPRWTGSQFPHAGTASTAKIVVEVAKNGDEDKDGVKNSEDKCEDTPPNTPVDKDGCELPKDVDSDKDGVLDSKDRCPNTPAGSTVTTEGCPVVEKPNGKPDPKPDPNDPGTTPETPPETGSESRR